MSTTTNQGENISQAIKVLKKTYRNVNLLFSEMDMIGKEAGFISLTPRFLRWKSDAQEEGWLINNFIKLYQWKEDLDGKYGVSDLKDGPVYVIEVDLEGTTGYPQITLSRFNFDLSKWVRMPAVADHWVFWDPYRLDKHFNISEVNGLRSCITKNQSIDRYWGLQKVVGHAIPLVTVHDAVTIKSQVFDGLVSLSAGV